MTKGVEMQVLTQPTPLWFLDNLARVHVSGEESGGELGIVEMTAREGDMPPLHVHHEDDETFVVLEGRLSLFMPGSQVELEAGGSFRAPRGIPHVYRVESALCRWLVVLTPSGFDGLVLDVAEQAPADELPPLGRPVDAAALAAASARVGIELLGPPGTMP
jgi:mannose-6-phosphate isomerase-like protein (cupin superfamily)